MGAITAESGSESAAEDYLRTSVRKSRDVRDSSDLTLLQFRLNANDRSLDASTVHSSLMRRSARHFYEDGEPEEAKRSWNDELPMLSSLNGPLNFANQRINQPEEDKRPERVSTNSHRSRYDEEPSPSYISSLNSRDMSYMIASKASNDPNFSRTGFSEAENGNHRHPYGRDSYSSIGAGFDNSLTLTSTLPDGLDFSTTIDSEGDMLLKNRAAVVNEKEIKRRADAYEREAATMPFDSHDNSNNTSELRKSGGSIESPFKEFRGHNTSMTAADLEGENGSDHSFALSDSNNMD